MNKISVIGAGTMGNGISQVFAQKGYQVYLVDLNSRVLEKAKTEIIRNMDRLIKKSMLTEEEKQNSISRIKFFQELEPGVIDRDLVIEAATENVEIKLDLFKKLDRICSDHTLLASNTSSISITLLGSVTQRPDKVIGMHFMNPVPVMKLVEIVKGVQTSLSTLKTIHGISETLDKIPVEVKDYPGFISNRILIPMINESIYCLMEGVAGIQEIDSIMSLGMSHPMGPLHLADFIGLDVCLSILEVLYNGFKNPKYAPCPLLVNMVTAGFLGVKSGKGFYTYDLYSKEKKVSDLPFLKSE
jgi:3-hydroxybutyryl-CoA dehydrogenase